MFNTLLVLIYGFIIPTSFLKFLLNYNHFLVSLLCLEFMALSFFLGFSLNLGIYSVESVFMLYFLVMIVCEGVLGLCLMILLSLFYGSDYLSVCNMLVL